MVRERYERWQCSEDADEQNRIERHLQTFIKEEWVGRNERNERLSDVQQGRERQGWYLSESEADSSAATDQTSVNLYSLGAVLCGSDRMRRDNVGLTERIESIGSMTLMKRDSNTKEVEGEIDTMHFNTLHYNATHSLP